MARNTETLTPRQRQSQRLVREKAAKKKRQKLMRKLQWAGGALALVLVAGAGVWAAKHQVVSRVAEAVSDQAYGLTSHAGFTLQSLYLEGRSRTPMADVQKALGVKKGDPILKVSIEDVRARLEQIPSVRTAAVERALPGTLYVRIVEREPVALWQHAGKVALVDDNGVVMTDINSAPYANLPLIVGEGAPAQVGELLSMLALEPDLASRFAAAVRVGERRWNIRLASGVEVRLPENNPAEAWKKLAEMQANQQLLDRNVKVIDLRVGGRLFIKLAPEDAVIKASGAKET